MENMKKRLAVFLCILFILPSILSVLPKTSVEVQAGNRYSAIALAGLFTSAMGGKPPIIWVEEGQEFYIGDYVQLYSNDKYYTHLLGTASMLKASYSSSQKSVAEVNGKGLLKTKSEGSSMVKVKYKTCTVTFDLRVEKKGSLKHKASDAKLAEAADIIDKAIPSKVTASNVFDLIKKLKAYQAVRDEVSSESLSTGSNGVGVLVVPQTGRFNTFSTMLSVYAEKNSPLTTTSAKVLKIRSVKARAKTVTVKLKKAPTTEQFLSMKMYYAIYSTLEKKNISAAKNKVYFPITIIPEKGMYISGLACMTKGSKTITITPRQDRNGKLVNMKLKKGTYRIGMKYDWTKGKKFKVK